jgi:hypothetical protein
LPGVNDDVYSNNFTPSVDISPTVRSVNSSSTTGITAGGYFNLNNGVTLTATTSANSSSNLLGTAIAGVSATFSCPAITAQFGLSNAIMLAGTTITIIGNITLTGGSASAAFRTLGTINLIGNMSNANGTYWYDTISSGTFNVTGNLTTVGLGIWNRGAFTFNLTGNISSAGSNVYNNTNAGTVFTHYGTATALGNATTIVDTGAGIYQGTGPFINFGDYSAVAVSRFRLINTAPTSMRLATSNPLVNRTLYTEDSVGGVPATSNVRSGTVYGIGGTLTGTLAVPSPSNVRQGVPTDNTVGTAALTPADFWDYLTSSATPGSMGARVAAIPTNPASVESTGAQIASFNT